MELDRVDGEIQKISFLLLNKHPNGAEGANAPSIQDSSQNLLILFV